MGKNQVQSTCFTCKMSKIQTLTSPSKGSDMDGDGETFPLRYVVLMGTVEALHCEPILLKWTTPKYQDLWITKFLIMNFLKPISQCTHSTGLVDAN